MTGNHPSGLGSPQEESQPAGFTAVNGDVRQPTSRTPTEPTAPSSTSLEKHKAVSERASRIDDPPDKPSNYAAPRVEDSADDREQDVSTGRKRKRANSRGQSSLRGMHVDTTTPEPHDRESSKRRHIQTIADSAIDLTSPDNDPTNGIQLDLPSERTSVAPHERDPSPVPRRNQKEPPPKPSTETEAILMESVRKFQENQQASQARSPEQDTSPEDDDDDDDDGEDRGDGPVQGDSYDLKKRKRNFSNRTKTGCHTCRKRKKKCDEGKPTCKNCDRGGFSCAGYGPKQPGEKQQVPLRQVIPLQSKSAPYEPPPGPPGYFPPPLSHPPAPRDGRQYNNWYGAHDYEQHRRAWEPPPHARPPSQGGRDDWGRPTWSYNEPRPPSHPPPTPFPPDHVTPTAFHSMPAPGYPSERPPPPPVPIQPPAYDPWSSTFPSYRYSNGPPNGPPIGPPNILSSRESIAGTGSTAATYFEQRDKMLSGKSFKLYSHGCLQEDIVACQAAVSEYNNAASNPNVPPAAERAKMFNRILDKIKRTANPNKNESKYPGQKPTRPTGDIGDRTIVQTPFKCDFGWHIHLGEDCVINSGCHLQDAGGIYIGDRVIVGPNVQILTLTRPDGKTDVTTKGSFGMRRAGTVKIEDDVEIGGGAIICPYVTIGKNARVKPGSVVTKDVKADWVVEGNPAVPIFESDEHKDQQNKVIANMEEMMAKHKWREDSKHRTTQPLVGEMAKGLFSLDHLKQ